MTAAEMANGVILGWIIGVALIGVGVATGYAAYWVWG